MNALTTLRDTALRRRRVTPPEDEYEEQTIVGQAVSLVLAPVRIATSRPAIKAYITALLFLVASGVLISISTTAYLFFYYNYIPQIGLTQTVYLQYDSNAHPYATVPIDTSALISQQPYDIYLSLDIPRTPSNLAAGNFMLDLSLLRETPLGTGPLAYILNATTDMSPNSPIARSRRPTILPYSSHITSLSHKLLRLPFHLLSLQDLDATALKVSMFERLSFARGRSNLPTTAYLEIQSQSQPSNCPPPVQPTFGVNLFSPPMASSSSSIQIYSAQLQFHARFEGLRYYVYNYRIVTYMLFTTLFYFFAVSSMAVAYALVTAMLSSRTSKPTVPDTGIKRENRISGVKKENDDLSERRLQDIKREPDGDEEDSDLDVTVPLESQALEGLSSTERTFPSLGNRNQPLRYTPSSTAAPSDDAETAWRAQVEQDDEDHDAGDEEDINHDNEEGLGLDIKNEHDEDEDDEDEDDRGFRGDSGIGTSMESEHVGLGVVRRRSSRGGSRAGSSRG